MSDSVTDDQDAATELQGPSAEAGVPAGPVVPDEPVVPAEAVVPGEAVGPGEPVVPAGPAQLRMRRAPRYRAFGLTGAGLGVVIGVILALTREVSNAASVTSTGADYSTRSVAGYFLAIFGLLGLAIGLGLAVLIERRRH